MKYYMVWYPTMIMGLLMLLSPRTEAADPIVLSVDGHARMPVVVSENATGATRSLATTLADYLGRLSGATFEIVSGGDTGIMLGQLHDFASTPADIRFETGSLHREDYVLRSTPEALWLIGADQLGVQHAVWDLLYRLGYRQFFPGAAWEVIPPPRDLSLAVDIHESPDFHARRIWYNWGRGFGYNIETLRDWSARNRVAQGFKLNSGHAYGAILSANRAAFEANPDYYALVKGERKDIGGDTKFCVGNPGLRQLVVDHAVRQFRATPGLDSISMDPSDGANWCDAECPLCAQIGNGSVSDRVLLLANEVAAAINDPANELEGRKYVGIYAYNRHSPPPSIEVNPNVIVSATTAFLTGGYSLEQVMTGWAQRGAILGVYDYFTVVAWDWNLPRRARTSRLNQMAQNIRTYHEYGARFYDAESGDAWGPYGLGFLIAARTMWDIGEADRVDEIRTDFLERAFGPAREPMAHFYHLITEDQTRRGSADLIGRMYRHLEQARKAAKDDDAVRRRIDDLILYTRYAEMFETQAAAIGDAKPRLRDAMLKHAYRMRETSMVHVYGVWARMIGQRAAHEKDHPLMDNRPFTEEDFLVILANGIAANQPVELDFETVSFSTELVPATPLKLPGVGGGNHPPLAQDRQNYYLWVEQAPTVLNFQVKVDRRWDLRPHRMSLFSPQAVDIEAVAESGIVRPDGKLYEVPLATPYDGLHRLQVIDGGDVTFVTFPEGMAVSVPCDLDTTGIGNHFRGEWTMYCYVPKGTRVFAGWAQRVADWAPRISGLLKDGDGNVLLDFAQAEDGWFSVPVPEGQDGRLWKFEKTHGIRQLVTVPPYLARSSGELLLPREVIEKELKNEPAEN